MELNERLGAVVLPDELDGWGCVLLLIFWREPPKLPELVLREGADELFPNERVGADELDDDVELDDDDCCWS